YREQGNIYRGGALQLLFPAWFHDYIYYAGAGDPRPQFYLALGDYQAGKPREALDRWAALIASTSADATWLDIVRENLAKAAEDLGLDLAEVMPEPLPAQGGGPLLTPEQRAEVEAMTPAERDAMVRDMVNGLDAKLLEDPMNLEGWERLIRARATLGERDTAQDALDRALEAFAKAPVPTGRLVNLAAELQLDVAQSGVDIPDIGSMVERLAARLEDDPDDLEGWMMLARSYTVLGELDKVREAMDNAVKLAPDNSDVLAMHARAVRDANGGEDNEETIAILRRVLELAPDNADALWFLGNAEAKAGNNDEARELLQRLLVQIPEDSPNREFVKQQIEQLGG
ncbi:MAG: tetratricopeptide repeat protein, partial [Alphaproteobacteria bacterium]|nr:tetratricopeptide repeat protein [Alphaproteobacteria bacterium]